MRKAYYEILSDKSLVDLEIKVQEKLHNGWELGGFSTVVKHYDAQPAGAAEWHSVVFYQVVYRVEGRWENDA